MKKEPGFGLTEVIISLVVISILMISFNMIYKYISTNSVMIREKTTSFRIGDEIFSKLKTIEYYYLFDFDSSKPIYGLEGKTFGPVTLQTSTYPYLSILREITTLTTNYSIDRWTVDIKFKLRDISDVSGDGYIGDLRYFIDVNNDGIDDYDPQIKYYKANADSDYYDTYYSTSLLKTCSELPDTNLKEVTLKLYKKGKLVYTKTELISYEMFSGIESRASGAELKLFISQPANNTYLYNLSTQERQDSFGLVISKPYPAEVIAYRADTSNPLRLKGETVANALVKFFLKTPITELDYITANMLGEFDWPSIPMTTNLTEGKNTILAQAIKDSFYSPYASREVIYDLNPPKIIDPVPQGITYDLMPYIGAKIFDTVLTTGIASGICSEVLEMKHNGNSVSFTYDSTNEKIFWKDNNTNLPVKLSTGVWHNILVEGGDNAYYKVKSTWSFIIIPVEVDHSAPTISNKHPIGTTSDSLPTIKCMIFDNQSGIDPFSIELKFNGQVVVSSTNVGQYYSPETNQLAWPVTTHLMNGSMHTVEVKASHWANIPEDKKMSTDSWWFKVSY